MDTEKSINEAEGNAVLRIVVRSALIIKIMDDKIKQIVDAIKINVEIAKVDGKPLIAEVSMNEKSKKYIAELIALYGEIRYLEGVEHSGNL